MCKGKIYELQDVPLLFSKKYENYYGFSINYNNIIFRAGMLNNSILSIWDTEGAISLGKFYDSYNCISNIKNNLDIFISGKIPCHTCNKPLSKEEIKLKYFAGYYCKDCVTPQLLEKYKFDYENLD